MHCENAYYIASFFVSITFFEMSYRDMSYSRKAVNNPGIKLSLSLSVVSVDAFAAAHVFSPYSNRKSGPFDNAAAAAWTGVRVPLPFCKKTLLLLSLNSQ